MYTFFSFLAALSVSFLAAILYGKSSKESGKQAAIIDIKKSRDRREKIAKLIESESIGTDSNSVADAWSKLSR
tara:strand:+ start:493 stop:711 length:219 start_codon:yes stop_codon:yes gene_type:complete